MVATSVFCYAVGDVPQEGEGKEGAHLRDGTLMLGAECAHMEGALHVILPTVLAALLRCRCLAPTHSAEAAHDLEGWHACHAVGSGALEGRDRADTAVSNGVAGYLLCGSREGFKSERVRVGAR